MLAFHRLQKLQGLFAMLLVLWFLPAGVSNADDGCCYELPEDYRTRYYSCIPDCWWGTCFEGYALCREDALLFIRCVGEDGDCPEPTLGGTVCKVDCDHIVLPLGNRTCDYVCLSPPGSGRNQGALGCPGGTFAFIAKCLEDHPECCP